MRRRGRGWIPSLGSCGGSTKVGREKNLEYKLSERPRTVVGRRKLWLHAGLCSCVWFGICTHPWCVSTHASLVAKLTSNILCAR